MIALIVAAMLGHTAVQAPPRDLARPPIILVRNTCKQYRNCREAVVAWCAGLHPRADGDHDGIPCENVCRSKSVVDKIKAAIKCEKH